jgi:hypothetical protein
MGQEIRGTSERRRDREEIDEERPPEREEIEQIIMALKNNKSPGVDEIQAEILKYGGEALREQVYRLIRDTWINESMPEEWSTAVLCPIHKKEINSPVKTTGG